MTTFLLYMRNKVPIPTYECVYEMKRKEQEGKDKEEEDEEGKVWRERIHGDKFTWEINKIQDQKEERRRRGGRRRKKQKEEEEEEKKDKQANPHVLFFGWQTSSLPFQQKGQ
jgi:hypothetical protein